MLNTIGQTALWYVEQQPCDFAPLSTNGACCNTLYLYGFLTRLHVFARK
jgi:hypothetical protein